MNFPYIVINLIVDKSTPHIVLLLCKWTERAQKLKLVSLPFSTVLMVFLELIFFIRFRAFSLRFQSIHLSSILCITWPHHRHLYQVYFKQWPKKKNSEKSDLIICNKFCCKVVVLHCSHATALLVNYLSHMKISYLFFFRKLLNNAHLFTN